MVIPERPTRVGTELLPNTSYIREYDLQNRYGGATSRDGGGTRGARGGAQRLARLQPQSSRD